MIEKSLKVATTLEARPAALFVQTASKFKSLIKLQIDNKTINAKSIMGLLSIGIIDGIDLTIIAEGEDESQAVNELERFLQTR